MTQWNRKKVAVTGAGGFIGSHLLERLVREGAQVRALVHYNSRNDWGCLEQLSPEITRACEIVPGDVTDGFAMQRFVEGREVVFHLAALIGIPYSYVSPKSYVDTNIVGTLNILEACRRHPVERLVQTSTSEVYGTAQYTPINEKHPLQGQSPYSATKIGADKIVESYFCSYQLPVVTARPFNTYGPRQSARAIIPTIISQALHNGKVKIGSQTPVRDLNYVRDTVSGFLCVAAAPKAVGKTINLSTGSTISIGDLARKILDLLGTKAELISDPQRVRPDHSEVLVLQGDSTLAAEICGWQSAVSLEQGLKETVDYIRTHQQFYKPEIYNI